MLRYGEVNGEPFSLHTEANPTEKEQYHEDHYRHRPTLFPRPGRRHPGAAHSLTPAEIAEAITRHAARDWGEVCREDSEANDWSIANGERVLSAYTFRDERCWVITEADRSVTTVLLPDEY